MSADRRSSAPIESTAAPAATWETSATGGWLIRITIIVIVLLWSIPTLGVLITSFRAAEFVNTSGWWTALAHPFEAAQWTIENYRVALDAARSSGARS